MKIGACISADRLETAARIGFDYAELAVTAVNSLSETQLKALQASPIPIETFNCLFPGDLPLIQSEDAMIRSYLYPALEKVASVGGKLVVFGSGGARRTRVRNARRITNGASFGCPVPADSPDAPNRCSARSARATAAAIPNTVSATDSALPVKSSRSPRTSSNSSSSAKAPPCPSPRPSNR